VSTCHEVPGRADVSHYRSDECFVEDKFSVTYSAQCAAVRMYCLLRMEAPQKCDPATLTDTCNRCHVLKVTSEVQAQLAIK